MYHFENDANMYPLSAFTYTNNINSEQSVPSLSFDAYANYRPENYHPGSSFLSYTPQTTPVQSNDIYVVSPTTPQIDANIWFIDSFTSNNTTLVTQQSNLITNNNTLRKKQENFKVCSDCGTDQTSTWRKYGTSHLCNPCGIYRTKYGIQRPTYRDVDGKIRIKRRNTQQNRECANCRTTETPCWRKLEERRLCNKCCLYQKLHGHPRPQKIRGRPY